MMRALAAAGYPLIPLRGKIPTVSGWQKTPHGTYSPESLAGKNYGVVLGPEDLVLDVDPRAFVKGDRPLSRLLATLGIPGVNALKTLVVRTGGGGVHVYFKKPPGVGICKALKEYQGIEFKTAGGQVVGPGSVHPETKQPYTVASGAPDGVAQAPAGLLELLAAGGGTAAPLIDGDDDETTRNRYADYLRSTEDVAVEGQRGDDCTYRVACRGRDMGLSSRAVSSLMYEWWNPRCSPPWDEEELRVKVEHAYRYAKSPAGSAHPTVEFDALPPSSPDAGTIKWITTPQGRLVRCFQNLLSFFQVSDGGLYKVFAYNEFAARVEFANPAPWHHGRLPVCRHVSDDDLRLLKGFLATRHKYDAAIEDLATAITNAAYHERFHPVREYLQGLTWDGVPRLDTWMKDYLGAVDGGYPAYLRAVSRKILCAAVMRVMRPGVSFDYVVVLEGAQRLGKSSVVKILGGEWASDARVDVYSRDTVDAMQGRWIVELAELETLRKADEDALKAFISRDTDRVRRAYGRLTEELPRQSVFIATKNPRADGTYLKDDTGNSRWWPVLLQPQPHPDTGLVRIDFKGLKAVRNQLFAEAVMAAKTEVLYMETGDLQQQADTVADARHAAHEWTERVMAWIETCDEKPETRRDFLTARDVWVEALGGNDTSFSQRAMKAIASILRTAGWKQAPRRTGNHVGWGWRRETERERFIELL